MNLKFVVLCSFLLFLAVFYSGSVYYAYNKGYDKKALEVEREAVQVVVGSHTDILVAAQNVKEKEKEIKEDEVCSAIWNFDLRECLHK